MDLIVTILYGTEPAKLRRLSAGNGGHSLVGKPSVPRLRNGGAGNAVASFVIGMSLLLLLDERERRRRQRHD